MALLTATHLDEIKAMVAMIHKNLENERLALPFNKTHTIIGTTLKFNDAKMEADHPFDYRKVKAAYFSDPPSILLERFPAPNGTCLPTPDELCGFDNWVAPVLAHEVCHRLQHAADPDMFKVGGRGSNAVAAKKTYLASSTWANYQAYLLDPVELEAHATQMAVEITLTKPASLDEAAFLDAAKTSDLAQYIRAEAPQGTGEDKTISAEAEALVDRIAAEAWVAYLLL